MTTRQLYAICWTVGPLIVLTIKFCPELIFAAFLAGVLAL